MNPAVLQHPSSFEILGTDLKYPNQDRTYTSLGGISTNECLYPAAKRGTSLTHPSLGNSFSLDHHSQSLLSDISYSHSSQLLLSPPDSVNGSTSASGLSSLSTFAQTLPKPYASNASSDHFNGVPGGIHPPTWSDVSMTPFDRHKFGSTLPSTSPYSANGLSNPFLTRPMDARGYQQPSHSISTNFASLNGAMRSFPGPYRSGTYYGQDLTFVEGAAMPASDSPDNKGPDFSDTVQHSTIVNRSSQQVKPELMASIHKGFFKVDGKWTCYRRNYFSVACAFEYKHPQEGPLCIIQNGQQHEITGYAVSISAKTGASGSQDRQTRGLVQHTPKRSKNTESTPCKHSVVPQTPLSLQQQHHHHHYHHPSHHDHHHMSMSDHYYGSAPSAFGLSRSHYDGSPPIPPSTYTFERIQFQKATANNGKRRAQQQFFHVVVELSVNISQDHRREDWVLVATRESDPMVVRGRSPGHYKDNHQRRDSQAHMDPDRNGGGGGDRSHMSYDPYAQSHAGSYGSSQSGHHTSYNGSAYRSCLMSNESPPSASSSATLTGSPEDADFAQSDNETLKSSDFYTRSRLTPPSEHDDESFFNMNRKRPLEEDNTSSTSPYQFSSSLCDTMSSHSMDYPTFPPSKVLCAS